MASFKAKFLVLQELFAKNHRGGPLGPPAGRGLRQACKSPGAISIFGIVWAQCKGQCQEV